VWPFVHSPRSGTKWSSKIITLHIQESADYLSEIEKYLGLVYEQFTPTATRSKHRQNTKHSSQTCTWLPLAIWIQKHLLPLREMNRQWTFVPQRKASKEERRAKKMKIVKTTIQEYKIPQWTGPWSRHYIQGTTKLHPLPFTNCATRNISPRNLLYYRATFHINRLKKNRLYMTTFQTCYTHVWQTIWRGIQETQYICCTNNKKRPSHHPTTLSSFSLLQKMITLGQSLNTLRTSHCRP